MTTGEFITKLRSPHFSKDSFNDFGWLFICGDNDFVNVIIYTCGLKNRRFVIPRDLSAIDSNNFDFVFNLLRYDRDFLIDENITIL